MGIRCWKFTDGETVAGQASQDSWKMEFKDMESTLETWKSTWQWKLCWISERRSAKIGSGGT